jgi:hypothetical protein
MSMGIPKEPREAKYFASVLSATPDLFAKVREDLELYFGGIEWESPMHHWDYSPAYSKELGAEIKRRIYVFRNLASPDRLPEWKSISNRVETKYSKIKTGHLMRRINIDPGYLNGSQVILASTKWYPNRIYLGDGIYADLTLFFDGCVFQPLKGLTLPEYKTRASIKFFMWLRRLYLMQVNCPPPLKEDFDHLCLSGYMCYS